MQLQIIYPQSTTGIPFFYIIEHIPTSKYYAGIKYAKNNHETDSSIFMTKSGYQTSSPIVWNLIEKDGLNAFKIRKIRHFTDRESIIKYEHKFLTKVNAVNNDKFLNRTNGGGEMPNNLGRKLSMAHKSKISDSLQGRIPTILSLEAKKKISSKLTGRKQSKKTCMKKSLAHSGVKRKPFTEEHKENIRKARLGTKASKETKIKMSIAHKR